MESSISDIINELSISEIIGNYVKLTGGNFLELFELALDKPSYNLLLLQLERMATNFVKEMVNRKEIEDLMNSIIDKGVVAIDIKTTDICITTSMHQTKLHNMLKNKDVRINDKKYNGAWKDLKPHGKGIVTYDNGNIYTGDMFEGYYTGKGIFTTADGQRYEGDFVKGDYFGKGVLTMVGGYRYEGDFVGNLPHGKGKSTYYNNAHYEGDYVDNQRQGKGIYTYKSGTTYEGDFVGNDAHGFGTTIYLTGEKHVGEYKNDRRNGKGIYISDDEQYEGMYVNDKPEGIGLLIKKNGDRLEGTFKNNSLNGHGIVINNDGTRYEGNFVDGIIINKDHQSSV